MKIISVAGASSKAGKTLLAEQIIRYCANIVTPVYAVKFTTTSDLPSPCPRGAPCTVCDLSSDFRIVRDPETLLQAGKNTARLAAAGATNVLWVIAKKSQLASAYKHLLAHIPQDALTIMEGSTITELCKPDLLFYIAANHVAAAKWKDSAGEIIQRSDFVLLNSKQGRPDAAGLPLPDRALRLDLMSRPATEVPEIRFAIESLLSG